MEYFDFYGNIDAYSPQSRVLLRGKGSFDKNLTKTYDYTGKVFLIVFSSGDNGRSTTLKL